MPQIVADPLLASCHYLFPPVSQSWDPGNLDYLVLILSCLAREGFVRRSPATALPPQAVPVQQP
jgi:hypothetical protein